MYVWRGWATTLHVGRFVRDADGEKYRVSERGLMVDALDLRDNGTYECRAEVSSHGNLKVRTITLDVQCQYERTNEWMNIFNGKSTGQEGP